MNATEIAKACDPGRLCAAGVDAERWDLVKDWIDMGYYAVDCRMEQPLSDCSLSVLA
jgi:hypothetical protein